MKKRLHLFQLIGFVLILFGVVLLPKSHAQVSPTELLVPLNLLNRTGLSAKVSSVLTRLEKRADIADLKLITVGNLATLQKDGQLTLTLPGRPERLTFKAVRVESRSTTDYEWHGELVGGPGTVSFLYKDGKLTGSLSQGDNQYLIYYLENGLHVWYQQKPDLTKTCMQIEATPSQKGGRKASKPIGPLVNPHYERPCYSFPRVLILYTPAAAQQVPDINQVAYQCVSQFNNCVYYGNVSSLATIELAGVLPLNFTETDDIESDLNNNLINNPTARRLREDTRADIVVLLTNSYFGYNGIAGTLDLESERAYAIVVINEAVGGRSSYFRS